MSRLACALVVLVGASAPAQAKPSLASCAERMKTLKTELQRQGIASDLSTARDRVELTVTFDPEIYYWSAALHAGKRTDGTPGDDRWHEYRETDAPDEAGTMPLSQLRHVGELEASVVSVYPRSPSLERDKKQDAPKREIFWRSARAALDDCLRSP